MLPDVHSWVTAGRTLVGYCRAYIRGLVGVLTEKHNERVISVTMADLSKSRLLRFVERAMMVSRRFVAPFLVGNLFLPNAKNLTNR